MASFQNLPQLAIDKVLGYLPRPVSGWPVVGPLLWTCHYWRVAVLRFMFETCYSRLTSDGIALTRYGWPNDLNSVIPYSLSWFRTLNITVEFPMTNPSFSSNLYSTDVLVLENVYNLVFTVSHHSNCLQNDQDVQNTQTNIGQLLEYLKQIAPNVVSVTLDNRSSQIIDSNDLLYIQLVHQIQRPVTGMARRKLISNAPRNVLAVDLGSLDNSNRSLSHIKFKGMIKQGNFELIRRSATTLQQLVIHDTASKADYNELIFDGSNHVVYPNMTVLKILFGVSKLYLQRIPDSVVPFPCLQKLVLGRAYPFSDNVLFRGNQLTLRCLHLELFSEVVEYLTKRQVFTSNSHPNLHHVKLVDYVGFFKEDTQQRIIDLLSIITRHAISVSLRKGAYTGDWLKQIELRKGIFGSVRHLDIQDPNMFSIDIQRLLHGFPYLTRLDCFSIQADDDLVAMKDLANSEQAKNGALEALTINNIYNGKIPQIVVAIIMLAIMCPNLQRLRLTFVKETDGFEQRWDEILSKEEYNQHAAWIRSITDMSPYTFN